MNATLVKAIVVLALAAPLCMFTVRVFARRRTMGALLELIGAMGLAMLGLTHVCEGLRVLPFMHWGAEHSPGHYLNLASVGLAMTLLPLGYTRVK